jgi:RNA polymerase sigma-70 factor (ECF subfamily)
MDIITVCGLEWSGMDFVPVRSNFEDLYRHEYPGLVAVAIALTGDRRDSEDLVQDTMVKAFVRWRHVGELSRPGGWCHLVLLNACRSWRRRRRTASAYLAGRRVDEAMDSSTSADIVAFWEVVRRLPTRPRTAVALHFAGGHTMAEVARILDVPEGTVRSDIARARVVLIHELGLTA